MSDKNFFSLTGLSYESCFKNQGAPSVEVLRASLLRYEKSISDDLAISEVQPCPVCFWRLLPMEKILGMQRQTNDTQTLAFLITKSQKNESTVTRCKHLRPW